MHICLNTELALCFVLRCISLAECTGCVVYTARSCNPSYLQSRSRVANKESLLTAML